MVIICFRVSQTMLSAVDEIVLRSNGFFTFRSEVFREAIQDLLDLHKNDALMEKMYIMSVLPS